MSAVSFRGPSSSPYKGMCEELPDLSEQDESPTHEDRKEHFAVADEDKKSAEEMLSASRIPTGTSAQDQAPISSEQLQTTSRLFALAGASQEACFIAVFTAGKQQEWVKMQPIQKKCDQLVNAKGSSLLLEAVDQGEAELAQDLVKHNLSIHTLDPTDNNALHYAIQAGERPLVAILCKHLDINQSNALGQTSLHLAAEHNQVQLIRDLLVNGAKSDACARFNLGNTSLVDLTPLHIAIIKDHRDCIDALLPATKTLPFHKEIGNLLHFAIHFRQYYVLKHLLTTHFEAVKGLIDQPNSERMTPVMCVAYQGEREMLLLLQAKRADLRLADLRVATSVSAIGLILNDLGKYEEALECYKRALAIREKGLDSNHPDVANSLNSIGVSLAKLGKQKEALNYYKRAINIACRAFKGEVPCLVLYLKNLINTLSHIEDIELVEQAKKELIPLCQKSLGENHAGVRALMAVKSKSSEPAKPEDKKSTKSEIKESGNPKRKIENHYNKVLRAAWNVVAYQACLAWKSLTTLSRFTASKLRKTK